MDKTHKSANEHDPEDYISIDIVDGPDEWTDEELNTLANAMKEIAAEQGGEGIAEVKQRKENRVDH